MPRQKRTRRDVLTGLGAVAAAGALGVQPAAAQGAVPPSFAPAMHAEDDWMSAMPGKHRVVIDIVSAERVADGLRFAANLLTAHKSGYGVDESEMAIAVVFRHAATAYGYGNSMWAKHGNTLDQKASPAPTANPFNAGERTQLSDLAKRGVQFMVCGVASRGIATRIAGQGGDADGVLKELSANLVTNARIVPAGVIGVTHAQERGFSLLFVG